MLNQVRKFKKLIVSRKSMKIPVSKRLRTKRLVVRVWGTINKITKIEKNN